MAQKCSEEGVPAVFFNMEPMETTMESYDNILSVISVIDASLYCPHCHTVVVAKHAFNPVNPICRNPCVHFIQCLMEPMETTMESYDNILYVGAQAKESGEMCAQALINYWNANT